MASTGHAPLSLLDSTSELESTLNSNPSGHSNAEQPHHVMSTPPPPQQQQQQLESQPQSVSSPRLSSHTPPSPPTTRPIGVTEALLNDALRSLPPAHHRDSCRCRHRSASILSTRSYHGTTQGPVPKSSIELPLYRPTTIADTGSHYHTSVGSTSQTHKTHSTTKPSTSLMAIVGRVTSLTNPTDSLDRRNSSSSHTSAKTRSVSTKRTKDSRNVVRKAVMIKAETNSPQPSPSANLQPIDNQQTNAPKSLLDAPEASETASTALAKASKAVRKTKTKLTFAPEQKRVRKADLPPDFESEDLYREIDQYIAASQERRRKERVKLRRRKSRSSRGSTASSIASSNSSSSSDADSDSSGSSSSTSARRLTISRLRSFFGDSSSSSSSSSDSDGDSSSSGTSSSSHSSNGSGQTDGAQSMRSFSFSISSRVTKPFQNRKAKSRTTRSEASTEVPSSPIISARTGILAPYLNPIVDLSLGKKANAKRQAKRARQAAQNAKRREAKLIKEGRLPPRPSRIARAKAARAQELAGGVTEYQLFTPMLLPMAISANMSETSEAMSNAQDPNATNHRKTMKTNSWQDIRQHFQVLRQYLRQLDIQEGDIALGSKNGTPFSAISSKEKSTKSNSVRQSNQTRQEKLSQQVRKLPGVAENVPNSDEIDFLGGDLALPPPALALNSDRGETAPLVPATNLEESKTDTLAFSSPRPELDKIPADLESEAKTGVRMSDLPLNPDLSASFGKDFGQSPRPFRSLAMTNLENDLTPSHPPKRGKQPIRREGKRAFRRQTTEKSIKSSIHSPGPATHLTDDHGAQGAWWLHVNCPTYRDMREISKLFPIHPLTVEDVLQQDPREKVDVYDKLGYYFVVVRAIDERYFRYTSAPTKASALAPTSSAGSDMPELASTKAGSGLADKRDFLDEAKTIDRKNSDGSHHRLSPSEKEELRLSGEPSFEMEAMSPILSKNEIQRNEHQPKRTTDERPCTQTRVGKARVEIVEGIGGKEGLEGVSVGAHNVYMLVFSHGIISFSFEDVQKHTDRVLEKLLDITQPVELTADWIAHDLYDSVVDSFFPLTSFLNSEVLEIETLVGELMDAQASKKTKTNLAPKRRRQQVLMGTNPDGRLISVEPVYSENRSIQDSEEEKNVSTAREDLLEVRRLKTIKVLRPIPAFILSPSLSNRLPRFLVKHKHRVTITRVSTWEFKDHLEEEMRKTAAEIEDASGAIFDTQEAADQSTILHRIAGTRKITTGLSRLLGPKNDAVKGLRKRLSDLEQHQRQEHQAVDMIVAASRSLMARMEVSMYLSDVHDHVISMLHQLVNVEGRLAEIHLNYLARIDINNRKFRQSSDIAILGLACVGLSLMSMMLITGIFSSNVKLWGNTQGSKHLGWFTGVVMCMIIIPVVIWTYMMHVQKMSRRRMAKQRAAR